MFKIRTFENSQFVWHKFNTLEEIELWVDNQGEKYKKLYKVNDDDKSFKYFKNSFMKKNINNNFCHIFVDHIE